MSDIWSHSHEWDNGYAKGHKDGYQQGRADAIDEFTNALINDGKVSAMRVLKIKEQLKEAGK